MPTGKAWNNIPQVITRLHAKYCSNEGLSRTSVYARKLKLFFFYGSYLWTTKNNKKVTVRRIKPFIFFLHKKMVAARSRFVPKVTRPQPSRTLLPYPLSLALEFVGTNDFKIVTNYGCKQLYHD